MSAIFISYNSTDRISVSAVQKLLQARGIDTFLDHDNLVSGLAWPQALEQTLQAVDGVAVFIGRELGGWQKREMWFALDRQVREEKKGRTFPVIPVLLPGADLTPGFLFLNTWIDLRRGLDGLFSAEALNALERAIKTTEPVRHAEDSAARTTERAEICPYRGLQIFREEDAAFFVGRKAFAEQLFDFTLGKNLVVVVGSSGSGKSSVVQAGLLPLLRRELPPANTWDAVNFTPGDEPFHRLASALIPLLEPVLTETARLAEAEKLGRNLAAGTTRVEAVINRVIKRSNGTGRLLLVADQFEELFTQTPEPGRRPFAQALLRARASAPVSVLITLRADFYSQIITLDRELSDIAPVQVNVGALTPDELRESITLPARLVGLEFESGLVDRLLTDVGSEPGRLPLVQFALTEIWQRREGRRLTNQAYDEIGGVTGALARRAEAEFARLNPEERTGVQSLFSRLVRVAGPEEAGKDTRQRTQLSDADTLAKRVAKRLADARLLVTGSEAATGTISVEVAHEVLIRNWERLRGWLNENREFLLWRQRLGTLLTEWERAAENDETLLRGPLLIEAQKWFDQRSQDLSDQEGKFISASRAQRERLVRDQVERQEREIEAARQLAEAERKRAEEAEKLAREEKASSKLRLRIFVTAGAALVATCLFLIALVMWHAAQIQGDNTEKAKREMSRQLGNLDWILGVQARDNQKDALRAGNFFFKSAEEFQSANEAELAKNATLAGVLVSRPVIGGFPHEMGILVGAIFNRDGNRILTWSQDGTAKLWTSGQNESVQIFKHEKSIYGAVFSHDESRILTWSEDGTARLWSVGRNEPAQIFKHEESVLGALFNRDESRILTWSGDGKAWLWTLGQNEPLQIFEREDSVSGAMFSRDGVRILIWSIDGTAWLWEIGRKEPVQTFKHKAGIYGAMFSHDESRILTWSMDGTARLWSVGQDEPVQTFNHEAGVYEAMFNHDESRILTACEDGAARLWTVGQDQPPIQTFKHENLVYGALFNNDDSRVLTWSKDGTARLWAVGRDEPVQIFKHENSISGAMFNGDGSRILTWSQDGARLWATLGQNEPVQTFKQKEDFSGAILNHDGNRILAWCEDGTARLWAIGQNEPAQIFKNEKSVSGALFNHDGGRILTWSKDGTARLWTTGQNEPAQIFKHGKSVSGALFNYDGSRILTWSEDGATRLWAIGQNEPAQIFKHQKAVTGAMFNHDGSRILTWSKDGTARLWTLGQNEPAQIFAHEKAVSGAMFNYDGSRILTWSEDGTAWLWTIGQNEPVQMFKDKKSVSGAMFNHDGSRILTWSEDGTARLWVVNQKEPVQTFKHEGSVFGAVFNRDESRILTWSEDGTARLWAVGQNEPVQTFKHEGKVRGAMFDGDESRILTWSEDRSARLWNISLDENLSLHERVLEFEIRSASSLHNSAELRELTFEEWMAKKVEAMRTKLLSTK